MVWPERWINTWDEVRAAEDDHNKVETEFGIGAGIAFPGATENGLSSFGQLGQAAIRNSDAFFLPGRVPTFSFPDDGRRLEFKSARDTGDAINDHVVCHISEPRIRRGAVLILPHWNARPGAYAAFSRTLVMLGVACAELELPYHGTRNGAGGPIADRFLSCNLGMTVRSVQQSVQDSMDVLSWLSLRGYTRLGVIGISLGSCVAGLLAAHDRRLSATALLLTAGDFAKVVWTGRATRHLRRCLERQVTLDQLRSAWSLISTETFADRLARPDHQVEIIRASRDTVVVPRATDKFVRQLQSAGVPLGVHSYPCGHYTLGCFPYGARVLMRVVFLLARAGFGALRKTIST
jgi:hypothetical protein